MNLPGESAAQYRYDNAQEDVNDDCEIFWTEVDRRASDPETYQEVMAYGFPPPAALSVALAKFSDGKLDLVGRSDAFVSLYNALHRQIPRQVVSDYPQFARYAREGE